MKLISCYVSSFGKLKDFTYEFEDGLNTVKEENGWGKSTFAAFIKAMFYGFDLNDSKHNIEENERRRYMPWNSTEKFGGYLIFERDGGKYKIERFFGGKKNDDIVKLYDLSTNKVYTEEKLVKDLGKRLFGIDEEGFLSTTYFSQKELAVKSNSAITAKFNEVCEVQGQESFEKAVAAIEDKMREIKVFRGDKGKLPEIKREISAINERAASVKQAINSIDGLEKDREILQGQCDELDKNIKVLTEELEKAGKRETAALRKKTYETLTAKKTETKRKLSEAENILNGVYPSEEQLSSCGECIDQLQRLSVKDETLTADLKEYNVDISPAEKPSYKSSIAAGIVAALLMITGAVLSFTAGTIIGLSALGAGCVVGIAALAIYLNKRKKAKSDKTATKAITEIIDRKTAELNEIKECEEKLVNGLKGFFGNFNFGENTGVDGRNKLQIVINAMNDLKALEKQLSEINAEISSLGEIDESADEKTGADTRELKEKLDIANGWLKARVSEKERITNRIETLKEQADVLFDLETRQKELQEEYSATEKEYKILSLTAEHLKAADEALKIKYREPLQNSLNKYLQKTGVTMRANIDTDMKVTVDVSGAERESGYFSKGYRNLFEICKRFALTDVLFTGEKPFIILDDPFYDLDDEKLKLALSVIKNLSDEYQILYLVCHESRVV